MPRKLRGHQVPLSPLPLSVRAQVSEGAWPVGTANVNPQKGAGVSFHLRCGKHPRWPSARLVGKTAFLKVALWNLILWIDTTTFAFSVNQQAVSPLGRWAANQPGPSLLRGAGRTQGFQGGLRTEVQSGGVGLMPFQGQRCGSVGLSNPQLGGLDSLHRTFHSSYQCPGDSQPVPSRMHISPSWPCRVWGFPATPMPPPLSPLFTFHQEHLLLCDCRLRNVVVSNVLILSLFLVKWKIGSCTKAL